MATLASSPPSNFITFGTGGPGKIAQGSDPTTEPAPLQGQRPLSTAGAPLLQSSPNTSGSGSSPAASAPTTTSTAGPRPSFGDYSIVKSKLLRPALTAHYICRFAPPKNTLDFLQSGESLFPGSNYVSPLNQELIELSCAEATLPGSSLMTNEINDDYTGVTERFVYRRQYDDRIDFTFYVDRDYRILNYFERWISYCVGENLQKDLDDANYFYRVNFPDDYQTDNLYVTKFERDIYERPSMEYKFIRAYPISIASMPISYESSQLLKCTVSFSYIRYVRRIIKAEKPIVVVAIQNSDGSWTVDLLLSGQVNTTTVSDQRYKYNLNKNIWIPYSGTSI